MQTRWILSCLVALVGGCKHDSVAKPESVSSPASAAPVPAPAGSFPQNKAAVRLPSRFDTFRALMAASDLPLAKGFNCDGVIGADAGKTPTLGDWVAYNLSLMEKGTIELPSSCSADGSGSRCKVEFSVRNDAENVLWRWGVAFRLDDKGAVDRASVWCTGAG